MKNTSSKFNTDKESLKALLGDYLADQGIDTRHNFNCLNPEHKDETPSMTYYADTQTVYCHACRAYWDIFDLYAVQHLGAATEKNANYRVVYPPSLFSRVFNGLIDYMDADIKKQHINIQKRQFTPEDDEQIRVNKFNQAVIVRAQLNEKEAKDYLAKRGITNEALIKRFKIGYLPNWASPTAIIVKHENPPKSPRLIIPTSSNSYLARYARFDDKCKVPKQKENGQHLFNPAALEQDIKPIFIVEGEIDALSVLEATDKAEAVGLGSTSNVDLFCDKVRSIRNRKLSGHKPYDPVFLIATDNDDAGRGAAKELEARLSRYYDTYVVNIARRSDDPNEELTKDRAAFTREVSDRIKDPDDYLTNLIKLNERNKDIKLDVPTGFANLDKALSGGLYPQLYVLGAVSSVGKTTFCLQIAANIAQKEKRPVFYFSLEMSKDELSEKNVSRLSYDLSVGSEGYPQTSLSILSGKWLKYPATSKLIMNAYNLYSSFYSRIHIFDGTLTRPTAADISYRVKSYKRKHPEVKPVVFVDYLQILAAMNESATDKDNVTQSIATFKQLASELEIPVVVISSFNRASYQSAAQMESFKEAGEIEYYSDTLMALQYPTDSKGQYTEDPDEAMQQDKRDLEIKILKNRNGKSGTKVKFQYVPAFNEFAESKDD